jgi:hypothetical protein
MQLSIKTNFPAVQAALDRLQADVRDRALASAMNKTIDQARTGMVREITSEFNVKAAYVRERLRVRRASAKGRFAIEASLIGGKGGRGRSANIIAFVEGVVSLAEGKRRAKAGTQNQLHVKVKKGGAKKPLKGAFIGNKGRTVFERVEGQQMSSRPGPLNKHSQAIRPVQVIDVAQMFNTKRINAKVVQLMRDKFPAIFTREARFYTDRFNRGGR